MFETLDFPKCFCRNLIKQYEFFPRAEISNGQETCSGVVNDESPLSEIIESDEEMTQRPASIYLQDDIQECVYPSTTEFDVDLSLDSLREKISGTCSHMKCYEKFSYAEIEEHVIGPSVNKRWLGLG